MNQIGVMQGRLTNKGGFYPQTFPDDHWQKEFITAKEEGFDCLEWMFNAENWRDNPIMTESGIQKIEQLIRQTGVSVCSVCANYFMKHSIYDSEADMRKQHAEILSELTWYADRIKCQYLIIPMFGASELSYSDRDKRVFVGELLEEAVCGQTEVLLETDLAMSKLASCFEDFGNKMAGICYDFGNAVGLGKNVAEEISEYGRLIKEIHIKDKKINGSTVMLGEGDALFSEYFSQLHRDGYTGCYVLESYYGENAVRDTVKNYNYIKGYIDR